MRTLAQRMKHAAAQKRRRDQLRAAGLCINGPRTGGHPPVVSGGKCEPCRQVHKLTADQARFA